MGILSPGTLVDHYLVESFIGAGSMGDVYQAVDTNLGRKVAVKILSDRHRDNKELRARFEREARAVAAIAHPNVVQVFTTGQHDSRPYIAMEFLDGVDLGSAVDRGGPWDSLAAARAILDAAHGLAAASAAGMLHRDVKPSNLVQLTTGTVKVTDFGLAKPIDPGDEPALTAMGVVVGTPDYIAPEQARGDPLGPKVDIYALGGTLFFMLTGRPPFRTGSPSEDKYLKVVSRHLRDPAPSARDSNRAVDAELAALGVQMMAKRAEDRPDYPGVIRALEAVIDRIDPTGQRRSIPMPVSPAGSGGAPAPTPYLGGHGPRSDEVRAMTDDPADSDVTRIHVRYSGDQSAVGSSSLPVSRPRASRWLIAVTVGSALVFAVGLGLVLFGPMPEARPDTTAPGAADAAPVATAPPDAAPRRAPTPPAGMLLVTRKDGTPWVFVDADPVTAGDIGRTGQTGPATQVTLKEARTYALARGKRLPRAEELDAAARMDGFAVGKKLWEWVDDGTVRRPGGKSAKRKPAKRYDDVTFRLAQDL